MNTKKIIIKIGIILSIFIIVFSFNTSYASSISDIFGGGDNFIDAGSGNDVNATELKGISDLIYQILLVLGISIAIIMSGVLGIRFMMGSSEEKAQVKEQLIPFIIGCIVIFGAFSIWSVVVRLGNKVGTQTATQDAQAIINGADITTYSNEDLKDLFSSQQISSDIYHHTSDPRNPNKVATVEEAVAKMSEYKQKIYNECKARGLLNGDGTGLK